MARRSATNTTPWDGKPFHKTVSVPQGKVQALWFGVDVPRRAKPGDHRATIRIRPGNAPATNVNLTITVLPTELAELAQRSLMSLSPQLREVIVLRLYEGLDYASIAEVVGTSAATARSRETPTALERDVVGDGEVCDVGLPIEIDRDLADL